jgi:hypothetical protein
VFAVVRIDWLTGGSIVVTEGGGGGCEEYAVTKYGYLEGPVVRVAATFDC